VCVCMCVCVCVCVCVCDNARQIMSARMLTHSRIYACKKFTHTHTQEQLPAQACQQQQQQRPAGAGGLLDLPPHLMPLTSIQPQASLEEGEALEEGEVAPHDMVEANVPSPRQINGPPLSRPLPQPQPQPVPPPRPLLPAAVGGHRARGAEPGSASMVGLLWSGTGGFGVAQSLFP
jgi:hypothetical protein